MQITLNEIARRRRSVRQYGRKRIADGVIADIMDTALFAPASFGHTPVEFVVVRDADMIQKIGACKTYGGSQVNGADTVVVVMVCTADTSQSEFWIEDGAVASAYLLLAAEEHGLGACWVHIRNRMGRHGTSDEEIRALLGVPGGYTVLNLVALGEKGEQKRPRTESEILPERVHYDSFRNKKSSHGSKA